MADGHRGTTDRPGGPVPRDPPDQQADTGDDHWDVPVTPTDDATEADDVPDTDEAGTGRHGTGASGAVDPEHPAPEESTG